MTVVIFCSLIVGNKRSAKGKFLKKSGGTPKEEERRARDRERKTFDRVLKIFDRLSVKSKEQELEYFCVIQRKNGEVHYSGTRKFTRKFQSNESLIEFNDSMLESRRESILKKINTKAALKKAVQPSPCKKSVPSQMTFLPGLQSVNLSEVQKNDLSNMVPQIEQSIALDSAQVVALKSRMFVRQRRRNPKTRLGETDKENKKGRKRGQKKQKQEV